jgi:hypothetical protein
MRYHTHFYPFICRQLTTDCSTNYLLNALSNISMINPTNVGRLWQIFGMFHTSVSNTLDKICYLINGLQQCCESMYRL